FMYRCHPLTLAVQEAVRGGAIGRLKEIRTSFCFRTTRIADNVRFRPDLAGGALMDVGCYCLSFARLFAGREPDEVYATGQLDGKPVRVSREDTVGNVRLLERIRHMIGLTY